MQVSVVRFRPWAPSLLFIALYRKVGDMFAEIVGAIMAAAPILDRMKREHQERDRLYREE